MSGDSSANRRRRAIRLGQKVWLGALLLLFFAAPQASAQINSNLAGVSLAAVLNSALTVVASPGTVNFALVQNGISNGSAAITVTTIWNLRPNVGDVTVYAYFTTPTAALSNGAGANIASSRVLGSANGGAFVPFTGASPFAPTSSITIGTWKILGNNRTGTRLDNLNLRINTTGQPLPAGTYNGVLNIQAVAL